jgi:hypothetical protein
LASAPRLESDARGRSCRCLTDRKRTRPPHRRASPRRRPRSARVTLAVPADERRVFAISRPASASSAPLSRVSARRTSAPDKRSQSRAPAVQADQRSDWREYPAHVRRRGGVLKRLAQQDVPDRTGEREDSRQRLMRVTPTPYQSPASDGVAPNASSGDM